MANSLIPAFNQIRLASSFVTVSGLRVQVGNDNTLMVRDSGNFVNQQQLTGLSGYLQQQIAGASAGVSQVNGLSGSLTIAGTGSVITVTQAGQVIYISGNNNDARNISGSLNALSGALTVTGQTLLSTIASTGQQAWNAAQNNALNLSGNLTITGQTLLNLVNGLSGQMNANNYISYINATGFLTGVITGADNQYVYFPRLFSRRPYVNLTMEASGGNNIFYYCGLSNVSTSGFTALFSDTVLETGLFLNVWASI